MQLFRFDSASGRQISKFGSQNSFVTHIAHQQGKFDLVCLHLGAGGLIGRHQAAADQLFLVVQGKGWVRGESGEPAPIEAGQAAFWKKGEWHESGSDEGMTVVVLESESLDPLAPPMQSH